MKLASRFLVVSAFAFAGVAACGDDARRFNDAHPNQTILIDGSAS